MEPTPKVGQFVHNPNYDIELKEITSDKKIGLILCNQLGESDRRGMQEGYMPRTAMQVANQNNSYDNMEMPYSVEVQTSMIGGRGMDDLVKDKTRYADGFRMDSSGTNPICGPAVLDQVGYKLTDLLFDEIAYPNFPATLDPNKTDPNLIEAYHEYPNPDTRTYNGMSVYFYTYDENIKLWYDVWSSDDTLDHLRYSITLDTIPGQPQWFYLPIPPTTIAANKTVRWYFQPAGGPTMPKGFTGRIFTKPAKAIDGNLMAYTNGQWSVYWAEKVMRSGLSYENKSDYKFFEYKNGLYAVKRSLDKVGSAIYRNGIRGMAQPNTANKNLLRTQYTNLTPHSLTGCIAKITNGPGELENQNWREIIDNDTTNILVSAPWNITHTADTEYVILGTNEWHQIATTVNELATKTITDILPLEDYVVFAFGDAQDLGIYREAKDTDGTWKGTWVWHNGRNERFDFLSLTQDNEGKLRLWGANANSCEVSFTEPVEFKKMLEGTEYFNFDIWKDTREELQLTIDRLTNDIATSVNNELIRLQRLLADAQEEKADIGTDDNSVTPPYKCVISRITEDIAIETDHSPELLKLNRMLQDATNERDDLRDFIIPRLEQDITSTTDADKKRDLERMLVDRQRELAELQTDHTGYVCTISRIQADINTATTHNPELNRLNRMLQDEYEKIRDLDITITRLTTDINAVVDADKLVLERQKEDAIKERDELLTYVKAGDTSSHITNMVIYGSPGIPYILKETEIGSIYENVYSKIPLGEVESVRSEINGRAAMAYGVYLYFNLEGGWIERYYDQQMNDVSPNQNEGLPIERQGEISKLMPYAGRWYAAINAGYNGISSVLLNNELGWHEVYRAPMVGASITDIYVQAIPGVSNADIMWIAEGNDIKAIPISISPLKQKNYSYFGQGLPIEQLPYIETAWIDYNYKDIDKYFNTLKLFVDMPNYDKRSGYEYECHVWFKTDEVGANQWNYIGTANARNEIQTYNITYQGQKKVHGKQIKFKIAMRSNVPYKTPRLKAWVCDAVIRFEVKKSWNLTFQLQPDTDLNGVKILMNPNEIYDAMEKWANSKTYALPLQMRTNDPTSDNTLVFIDPATIQRRSVNLSTNKTGAKKEFINIGTAVVYEV